MLSGPIVHGGLFQGKLVPNEGIPGPKWGETRPWRGACRRVAGLGACTMGPSHTQPKKPMWGYHKGFGIFPLEWWVVTEALEWWTQVECNIFFVTHLYAHCLLWHQTTGDRTLMTQNSPGWEASDACQGTDNPLAQQEGSYCCLCNEQQFIKPSLFGVSVWGPGAGLTWELHNSAEGLTHMQAMT